MTARGTAGWRGSTYDFELARRSVKRWGADGNREREVVDYTIDFEHPSVGSRHFVNEAERVGFMRASLMEIEVATIDPPRDVEQQQALQELVGRTLGR